MRANLTYYIWEGVLTGTVNGRMFHILKRRMGVGSRQSAASDQQVRNLS